jgi:hypothetical protein
LTGGSPFDVSAADLPRSDPMKYLSLFESGPRVLLNKLYWKYMFKTLDKDDPAWAQYAQAMTKSYMEDNSYEKDGVVYLKKGTKLYHGSRENLDPRALFKSGNRITFFGAEPKISLWYILETCSNNPHACESIVPCIAPDKHVCYFDRETGLFKSVIGFLYTFELVQDLPIGHYWDDIIRHPSETKHCRQQVCLHPQISYRGSSFSSSEVHDLSIEVTMPYVRYRDYMTLVNKQVVNVSELALHTNDALYDARNAIISG